MWFLGHIMPILCTAKISRNDCLEKTNDIRTLYAILRKRQAPFFGPIKRGETLESIDYTGKISSRKATGKAREIMIGGPR